MRRERGSVLYSSLMLSSFTLCALTKSSWYLPVLHCIVGTCHICFLVVYCIVFLYFIIQWEPVILSVCSVGYI